MNRIFSAFLVGALSALFTLTGFSAEVTKGPIPNVSPVANQVPDYTGYIGVTRSVDLLQAFTDPDATAAVRMVTNGFGNIDVVLFGRNAPNTVANFLRYVDEGRYFYPDKTLNRLAPAVIHQSLFDTKDSRPVTLQGGDYFGLVSASDKASWIPFPLEAAGYRLDPIKNEYNGVYSNVTGTISMATVPAQHNAKGTLLPGTGPDTATSQWFINLGDNNAAPYNFDSINGNGQPGDCVFGRVLQSTMTNVYAIASLSRFDFSGSSGDPQLVQLPLQNYTQEDYNAYLGFDGKGGDPTKGPKVDTNVVTLTSISEIPPMNFTAAIDNPAVADVTLSGTFLHITPKQAGTAKITVTATDLDGAGPVTQSFNLTTATAPGRLVNISTRMQVGTGENVLIGGFIVRGTSDSSSKHLLVRGIGPSLAGQSIANPLANPVIELRDSTGALVATNDNWQASYAATNAINDTGIPPANAAEAALIASVPARTTGSGYTVILKGVNNGVGVGLVEVYDLDAGPGSTALNISTRGNVGTDQNVMIGGFLLGGTDAKKILVRGIGPSLTGQGVSGALADPQLELRDPQGNLLDSNDDWQLNPHQSDIQASGVPPSSTKEAAMYAVLAPGGYTAVLKGGGPAPTGVALVEVFQLP